MIKLTTKEIALKNSLTKPPHGMDSCVVWLHNVRSLHNVGSVFRSADAFKCKELLLSGYTPVPPRPEISKTALGAEQHVTWREVHDIHHEIDSLRASDYLIIGIEQTSNSENLINLGLKKRSRICYMFGNEVDGIDEDMLKHCNQIIEIPQFGKKHSLNVSVAAGIVLYATLKAFSEC